MRVYAFALWRHPPFKYRPSKRRLYRTRLVKVVGWFEHWPHR